MLYSALCMASTKFAKFIVTLYHHVFRGFVPLILFDIFLELVPHYRPLAIQPSLVFSIFFCCRLLIFCSTRFSFSKDLSWRSRFNFSHCPVFRSFLSDHLVLLHCILAFYCKTVLQFTCLSLFISFSEFECLPHHLRLWRPLKFNFLEIINLFEVVIILISVFIYILVK